MKEKNEQSIRDKKRSILPENNVKRDDKMNEYIWTEILYKT